MSRSTFVRWVCNHCRVVVESSLHAKPEKGITYAEGRHESSVGSQDLPDVWFCGDCSKDFAEFCNMEISPGWWGPLDQ